MRRNRQDTAQQLLVEQLAVRTSMAGKQLVDNIHRLARTEHDDGWGGVGRTGCRDRLRHALPRTHVPQPMHHLVHASQRRRQHQCQRQPPKGVAAPL